jgi:hypothetical protein
MTALVTCRIVAGLALRDLGVSCLRVSTSGSAGAPRSEPKDMSLAN